MASKSFSFNFNSNVSVNGKQLFSSKSGSKKKMSPQEEYWLNRILRDYSGKVFFIVILFFALMFAVVYFASNSPQNSKSVEINKSFVR